MRSSGLLFVDGQLAGSWTRKLSSTTASIEVLCGRPDPGRRFEPKSKPRPAEFGAFVERPVELELRVDDSAARK